MSLNNIVAADNYVRIADDNQQQQSSSLQAQLQEVPQYDNIDNNNDAGSSYYDNGNKYMEELKTHIQLLKDKILNQYKLPLLTFEQCRILNLTFYIINVIIVYGIGVMGGIIFSVSTNKQVSENYQTLITPAGYTFSIWGIIYLFQLLWILQQYMNYNSNSYYNVIHIQYKYMYIVILQCLWTISFSNEYLIASVFIMFILLYSLWNIVLFNRNGNDNEDEDEDDAVESSRAPATVSTLAAIDEQQQQSPTNTNCNTMFNYPAANEVRRSKNGLSIRYWIEEFPFTIHFGWILLALCVNINIVLIAHLNHSIEFEYYFALITLYIIAIVLLYIVFSLEYITVPIVISWGLYGIYYELIYTPSNVIISQYNTKQIYHIAHISFFISTITILIVCIRIVFTMKQKCSDTNNYVDNDPYYENQNNETIEGSSSKPIVVDDDNNNTGVQMPISSSTTTTPATTGILTMV